MQVAEAADEITLQLQAKPGTQFDTSEIAACLDHTIVMRSGDLVREQETIRHYLSL